MTVDRKRAEAAIREFLQALDLSGPVLSKTPERVTEAFVEELLWGHGADVQQLIEEGSEEVGSSPTGDPVLLEDLRVVTVCPHHLLPARGQADVAYVPGRKILGLGTLARLVQAMSRRLVLQEEIAPSVVEALMKFAGARGAYCRLRLDHDCLQVRGAEQHAAKAQTWAGRGELSDPRTLEAVLKERVE